ncbi:hypothetical protein OQI_13685 [Streptomyces pharetrae CZA14]|uniref:Transposase IS701-like DDE domain-containing protein n=1 Tax=Streptomyces pharetrae CZA14 TaxID=1144883 RepID=A0ABX3YIX1_9ACTN|nr:hypothetical protein OQI_13685 [Streptomyces pharetrae CZA14]
MLKKGVRSAGVQRQYSGTAGRTEDCQIGVFPAYATSRGRTLIDRRLYLPTSWTDDRERCRRAGIGDGVAFETKVAMARAMVRRAIADEMPFRWVTANAAYASPKAGAMSSSRRTSFTSWPPPAMTPSSPDGRSITRPRPVSRPAPAEVETPFLRRRRSRPTDP